MIKLEESDGGVRRKHRGKSQFAILFFFFPHLLSPSQWVEGAELLGWLCLTCWGSWKLKRGHSVLILP